MRTKYNYKDIIDNIALLSNNNEEEHILFLANLLDGNQGLLDNNGNLPEWLQNLSKIDNYAFYNCTNLTSITIPDSVTSIDNYAFYNCTNLTSIYMHPTTPPSLGNTSAIASIATIHVPAGSGDTYKSATNWSSHASRIVEDIEI